MLTTPFTIGQTYYLPMGDMEQVSLPCPVCAGTCCITIILGDGESVKTPCEGCVIGFESPRGTITEWRLHPRAIPFTISEVLSFHRGHEWRVKSTEGAEANWHDLDTSEEKALKEARKRASAQEERNMESHQFKRKNTKRAGWTVRYHRNAIKNLERQLLWHQEKVQSLGKKEGI